MNATGKRGHVQLGSHSLIEFLLGDGVHPGWLDEQKHHPFATVAKCPGYPANRAERQATKNAGRGVLPGGGSESESGFIFGCSQNSRAAGMIRRMSGTRSTL